MSGACSSVPCSASASVAIEPGMFLAHKVVPSTGSTAISTLKPPLLPTFSPMNSIGASSSPPSPITPVPSIGKLLSSRRMASTAAWSAAFSSPRPRSRAALTAARSVTRTISIVRMRSSIRLCGTVIDDAISSFPRLVLCAAEHDPEKWKSVFGKDHAPAQYLVLFDPDDLRPSGDYTVAAHRGERLVDRVLGGRVGDENDRNRIAGLAGVLRAGFVALHNRFERDLPLRQPPRDCGRAARAVACHQPDVVAAFVALHGRLAHRRHARGGLPERRRSHAARTIGQIRHER